MNECEIDGITVVDDFLGEAEFATVTKLLEERGWSYGWRSSRGRAYGIWHMHFAGGDKDCRDTCDATLHSDKKIRPCSRIWSKLVSDHLSNYSLLRAYANAQTFGLDGGIHTDNLIEGECRTAILYVHPQWAFPWGGDLVFYSPLGEVLYSVSPKSNRLVVFDSALPHMARAPSRESPALRMSLVFKAINKSAKIGADE